MKIHMLQSKPSSSGEFGGKEKFTIDFYKTLCGRHEYTLRGYTKTTTDREKVTCKTCMKKLEMGAKS